MKSNADLNKKTAKASECKKMAKSDAGEFTYMCKNGQAAQKGLACECVCVCVCCVYVRE